MSSLIAVKLKTYWKLGLSSVIQVAAYRIASKIGLYRFLLPICSWGGGSVFYSPVSSPPPFISSESRVILIERVEALLNGNMSYFSGELKQVGSPPDWFLDPFSGNRLSPDGHWSKINEFSAADIKTVWEASRFEWVPLLSRAWRVSGDSRYIDTLNQWLHDWVLRNLYNAGPNWKCGQEASIRTINLLLGARLLGTHWEPSPALIQLVVVHCRRILPTLGYAIAQNNNHGTSEAAALYIGGTWLKTVVKDPHQLKSAQEWQNVGRCLLEDRVKTLVAEDGSFSQYSVNYHRVLLDTLCQVEIWRREYGDHVFSDKYLTRCRAAASWLVTLTDPDTGYTPNLGANDGARLYDLSVASYRDFRPSGQLAMALFTGTRAYTDDGPWDEPLTWLGITPPEKEQSLTGSQLFDDGGYAVLRRGGAMVLLRYPRFRFRPGHADSLHVDFWQLGENLLRDAGTYSYNADPEWLNYFSGTESHNTIQFDNRDQMPRLGRFLFGDWLKTECLPLLVENGEEASVTAAYCDRRGSGHQRTVRLINDRLIVCDEVKGFTGKAVMRWRLRPGNWRLEGQNLTDDQHVLVIAASVPIASMALVSGWESLYYMQKIPSPVLTVEIHAPGILTTEYRWMI